MFTLARFNLQPAQAAPTAAPPPPPPARVKGRDPTPFDGHQPRQVRPFLLSCVTMFRLAPLGFRDDSVCVGYASSFLTGSAAAWFENMITYDPTQAAVREWDAFAEALTKDFGEPFPHFSAQSRLYRSRMGSNARIMEHNAEFAADAGPSQLDSTALAMLYYESLPRRLQVKISEAGRPMDFTTMCGMAAQFDRVYWENQPATKGTTSNAPHAHQNAAGSSTQAQPAASTSTADAGNSGRYPRTAEDRKAINKERREKGLCFFCGSGAHNLADCPNTKEARAKAASGRAASVGTPSAPPAPAPAQAPTASIVEVVDEPKKASTA